MLLLLSNNETVLAKVRQGERIVLGRAHFPHDHPLATHVSRQQCEVRSADEASAKVLSLSAQTPTVVLREDNEHELKQGEWQCLSEGDKILLHKSARQQYLRVVFAEAKQSPEYKNAVESEEGDGDEAEYDPAIQASTPQPVMLVLCGAPGSGKSTFSHALCSASALWTRVNQDTVKDGRRGSQPQCLALARAVLCNGGCCVIDRCHVDASQRENFIKLAQLLAVKVHAVVLNLPAKSCGEQAMKRTAHEGGLQGPEAKRIAHGMAASLQRNGMPSKAEGFVSILVCDNHKDIARALDVWKTFPDLPAPEAAFKERGGGRSRIDSFFSAASRKRSRIEGDATTSVEDCKRLRSSAANESDHSSSLEKKDVDPALPRNMAKTNAFAALMASAARKQSPPLPHSFPGGDALRRVALDPERERSSHPGLVSARDYVIIHDKFPKARLHGLVIARSMHLAGPGDLSASDLPLLAAMKEAAAEWVRGKRQGSEIEPVRIGFHSLPSMKPLHLHVISQDFDSVALKTKKHWNSFTSGFFVPISAATRQLECDGKVKIDSQAQEMLKADLQCHKCQVKCKSMSVLKDHLKSCTACFTIADEPLY